jgi:hypothetical protein
MKLQSIVQSQDNGVFRDAEGGIPQGESAQRKPPPPIQFVVLGGILTELFFTLQVKQLAHPC